MNEPLKTNNELSIFKNTAEIPEEYYKTDPDKCCDLLKVIPTKQAIEEMKVRCWVTGLRCTECRTRTDYKEVEERDKGLIKLNPILIWKEREIWQYLALNNVKVNPLYNEGYRSLCCEPSPIFRMMKMKEQEDGLGQANVEENVEFIQNH